MKRREEGYILVLALTVMLILGLMLSTLVASTISASRSTGLERGRTQAFYAAQSGLERITRHLNDRSQLLTTDNADTAAGQLIVPSFETGSVTTGAFTVDMTKKNSTQTIAVVHLKSTGTNVDSGATRILEGDVQVLVQGANTGLYAPAALITTGDIKNNGAAPVSGEVVPIITGVSKTRIFNCSSGSPVGGNTPCKTVTGGLNTYTLTTQSIAPQVPPAPGTLFTDATGQQYSAQKVTTTGTTPLTSTVTLVAMNENPASALTVTSLNNQLVSNPQVSLTQSDFQAMSSPVGSSLAAASANTSGVCLTYGCSNYNFSPSALFQMIFGTTKEAFKARMQERGTYYSSGTPDCNARIVWVVTNSFDNNCPSIATAPKVLIIDASTANTGNVQIKTDNTFYGFIYVISGTNVSLAGNGTYVGSVISETSIDASNFQQTTVVGNGSSDCPNTGTKPAKICYKTSIAQLMNTEVQNSFRVYKVSRLPNSWTEGSQ